MEPAKPMVAIIHTSFVSVDYLKELYLAILPGVVLRHIVDDSLLAEVMANGGLTPAVTRRVCQYARHAEEIGADLVFNQCSSVGEAVNIARKLISIPYLKVDEPMAAKAVELGARIGVVATVASTMRPSVGLVREAARAAEKSVEVREYLVDGALEVLMKERNREKHNALVLDAIRKAEKECDVIVLAQGSMVVLEPLLGDIGVPVLTSPRLGVEAVRARLGL